MSHQANYHINPYFGNGFARPLSGNGAHQLQNEVQEDSANDGQTLTEETRSETTSDTDT